MKMASMKILLLFFFAVCLGVQASSKNGMSRLDRDIKRNIGWIHRFKSYNAPNMWLRHRGFVPYIDNIKDKSFVPDSSFRLIPGLNGGGITFQPINTQNRYIRHGDIGQSWLTYIDQSDQTRLFNDEATYYPRRGLVGENTVSFESADLPGHFLKHVGFRIRLVKNDGSLKFKEDASWTVFSKKKSKTWKKDQLVWMLRQVQKRSILERLRIYDSIKLQDLKGQDLDWVEYSKIPKWILSAKDFSEGMRQFSGERRLKLVDFITVRVLMAIGRHFNIQAKFKDVFGVVKRCEIDVYTWKKKVDIEYGACEDGGPQWSDWSYVDSRGGNMAVDFSQGIDMFCSQNQMKLLEIVKYRTQVSDGKFYNAIGQFSDAYGTVKECDVSITSKPSKNILKISYSSCPASLTELGKATYRFVKTKRTWFSARDDCRDWGGELATVTSQALNKYLLKYMKSRGPFCSGWIGYSDFVKEGNFVWTGSSSSKYTNWNKYEPNGKTEENCVHILPSGKWNDIRCDKAFSYICEKENQF